MSTLPLSMMSNPSAPSAVMMKGARFAIIRLASAMRKVALPLRSVNGKRGSAMGVAVCVFTGSLLRRLWRENRNDFG